MLACTAWCNSTWAQAAGADKPAVPSTADAAPQKPDAAKAPAALPAPAVTITPVAVPAPAAPTPTPAPPATVTVPVAPTPTPAPPPDVAPPPAAAEPSAPRPPPSAAALANPAELHEALNQPLGDEIDTRKHTGISARLSAGIGYARASRSLSNGSQKVSGLNGVLSLDIGAAAIENLIVYGRIGGFAFNHLSSSDSNDAGSVYVGLLGAGARYHFMPIDWYAGGTLALAAVSVTNALVSVQNTTPGFAFQLETGKNWWAGTNHDNRAFGLGLRFDYVRSGSITSGTQRGTPWVGTAFSLVFSTAYN